MSKKLVIVDDSDSVAASLAIALEGHLDVFAIVAHHPRAALTLFQQDGEIAIVVTDLNLPFLNGFQLIGELRKIGAYEFLPALMITADDNAESQNPPADCRPNVIMRKPFSFREVCSVVESLLK